MNDNAYLLIQQTVEKSCDTQEDGYDIHDYLEDYDED